MKRKLSILSSFYRVVFLTSVLAVYATPSPSQSDINVITFLEAVARVCGGSTSQQISTVGDNISLRTAEVTIDPGTGKLSVESNGVLIAEVSGEQSDSYYNCVEGLTETLGGAFTKPSQNQSEQRFSTPSFVGKLAGHFYDPTNVEFIEFLGNHTSGIIFLDVSISTDAQADGYVVSNFCTGNYYEDDDVEFSLPIADFSDIVSLVFNSDMQPKDYVAQRIINFEQIVSQRCSSAVVLSQDRYTSLYAHAGGVHGMQVRGFFSVSSVNSYGRLAYLLAPVDGSSSDWALAPSRGN